MDQARSPPSTVPIVRIPAITRLSGFPRLPPVPFLALPAINIIPGGLLRVGIPSLVLPWLLRILPRVPGGLLGVGIPSPGSCLLGTPSRPPYIL